IVNGEGDIEEMNSLIENMFTKYLEEKFPFKYLSFEIKFEKEILYLRFAGEEDYDIVVEIVCSGFFKVKGSKFEDLKKKFYYREEFREKDLEEYTRILNIGGEQKKTMRGNLNFSFAIIPDLHIGGWYKDYGGAGYNDSNTTGQENDITRLARASVLKVNQLKNKYNIKFAIVIGDLTDSGERSEFEKAKEILDNLTVPYIPLLGNHDVWPYTSNMEAQAPIGDQYFNDTFDSHFNKLKNIFPNWDDGTRVTAIWNGEADTLAGKNKGAISYFQNFAFDYGGYHFICTDFNSRDHAKDPRGLQSIGSPPDAQADLFDSNLVKGTWSWLKNHLREYPNKGKENIFIFAHHPLTKHISGYFFSFGPLEYMKVTNYLHKYRDNINSWFAGHYHDNRDYNIKTWWLSKICMGIETSATFASQTKLIRFNYDNDWYNPLSTIRIVKVYSSGSIDYDNIYEGLPEEFVKNGNLSKKGDNSTFSVELPYGIHTVALVGNSSANFDLYLKWGSAPNTTNYDAKSTSLKSAEVLSIEGSGKLYVMIYSSNGSGSWKSNIVYGALIRKTTNSLQLSGKGSFNIYENVTRGKHSWVYLSEQEHGDFSLYLKWNSKPTEKKYDGKGDAITPHEIVNSLCRCTDNSVDKLYVMVSSKAMSGNADLLYLELGG
ncbi:MAG: metallophosphoesterase, partial [Candidatus Thermoplasmatota archaeon]